MDGLERRHGTITPEWKYYGRTSGWTLKVLLKKRNLFFLAPCDKRFRVAFVFGDKAVKAVEQSGLPKRMIRELKDGKRYPEGRALRMELRKAAQVEQVLTLAAIKAAN